VKCLRAGVEASPASGDSRLGCPGEVNLLRDPFLVRTALPRLIGSSVVRHASARISTANHPASVPAHVVQRRVDHAEIEMTHGIYAHALPSMQHEAVDYSSFWSDLRVEAHAAPATQQARALLIS
jgi:hypothetical protein